MTSTIEERISPRVKQIAAEHLGGGDDIVITRVTGDASTRSYYRAKSGEKSIIIALYSEPFDEREAASSRLSRLEAENPSARLSFASDPCAYIEVTELFARTKLPVPAILAASGSDSAILIEDVGDLKLQEWLEGRASDEVAAAYRGAIELIVKIQEATAVALDTGSICSRLAFDEAKLRWELGFFFANYFNRYLGAKLDQATANGVQADFRALCSDLAARPRVLTHRDYHARNLMMKDGRMFIIDHQDARMGPASYDLASLLSDPYTSLDRRTTSELVEYFIELKSASCLPLESVKDFKEELALMTVQRMLKAVGTYAYQAAAMNNPIYVSYIRPAIERAVESMAALGRFNHTLTLLSET
ncbi:MAG TPA: phosphotransferase [Blastocatellia bacterium]|nr:phosphotransferase [Blastocatellia bacterium]